jgi:hypothetical protein
LLFIFLKCSGQFDLYVLRFSSTGSTFNSSKISSFILWSHDGFGGLVVSMLTSGSRVRGFKPSRSLWIFLM